MISMELSKYRNAETMKTQWSSLNYKVSPSYFTACTDLRSKESHAIQQRIFWQWVGTLIKDSLPIWCSFLFWGVLYRQTECIPVKVNFLESCWYSGQDLEVLGVLCPHLFSHSPAVHHQGLSSLDTGITPATTAFLGYIKPLLQTIDSILQLQFKP